MAEGLSQVAGRAGELEKGISAGKSFGELRKKQPASPAPAAASPSQPTSPAPAAASPSQPESAGWSLPLPDLSLPGNSTAEKALVVFGILLIGLMLYGRVTGKPIFLGLASPSAGNPQPLNPSSVGGAIAPPSSMARRIAAVNPAKVA